jgi:hypothetical protein
LIETDSENSEKLNKKNLIRNQIPLAALEFEDRSPSHDSRCAGRRSRSSPFRSVRLHPCRASSSEPSTTQSVSNLSCSFNTFPPPFPDAACSVFCISSQPVRLLPQLSSARSRRRTRKEPSLLLVLLRVNQVCTPKKEKVFNPFPPPPPPPCLQISWICERFKIQST